MRTRFSIVFLALIVALASCSWLAHRSHKAIGRSVALLAAALIPPVIGNLVIVAATTVLPATYGYYIYFLGMDVVMLSLLRFTFDYCQLSWPSAASRNLFYLLIGIDVVQLLCNPLFGHAFSSVLMSLEGAPYYQLLPLTGLVLHRVFDYGIFVNVILIFLMKTIRTPRINSERYSVILFTMVAVGLWQTFYILSRTPIDRSMIGFGVFGLLVYYFSLQYRPVRLLDRQLAAIASEMPEALFCFDTNGTCIWANRLGIELTGIDASDFDEAATRLVEMFGPLDRGVAEWSIVHTTGKGEAMKSYVLSMRAVLDEKGRPAGSFLTVRDNSDEQRTLQQEMYKATHDALTKVYNRSGYELLLTDLPLDTICLMLFDVDRFKNVNDTYGHEVGDRILQKLVRVVGSHFRSADRICRIGGDEFVVLMETRTLPYDLLRTRVGQINHDLADTSDGLPPVSISAGIAHGNSAADTAELFAHADDALYRTKRAGRNGFTFYAA